MPQFCHFASPKKIINKQQSQFALLFFRKFQSFYNFRNWKSGRMEAKKEDFFLTDKSKSVASVLPKSRKTLKWRPSSSKKLEGWKKKLKKTSFFLLLLPMTFLSWPFGHQLVGHVINHDTFQRGEKMSSFCQQKFFSWK